MDEIFEIPCDELPSLRDLFLQNWPENMIGYYTIDNYIRWLTNDPNIRNLKIYSLNNDFRDGTFVVIVRV